MRSTSYVDWYMTDSYNQFDMLTNEISKPIVAAINGYCLGGGLELALMCDVCLVFLQFVWIFSWYRSSIGNWLSIIDLLTKLFLVPRVSFKSSLKKIRSLSWSKLVFRCAAVRSSLSFCLDFNRRRKCNFWFTRSECWFNTWSWWHTKTNTCSWKV